MGVRQEAEVIYISCNGDVDKIYPTKAYRKTIIELLHKEGKHLDIVMARDILHYRGPGMKQDNKSHVSNCKTCFVNKPSKSEAQHSGLSIPLKDLSPMDWISTDLMEIKDKKGN